MSKVVESRFRMSEVLLFILALLFTLLVQGALPFFSTPTFLQALWTTGFSQSFLNESVFSIYARNIGAPEPAAISFGLAGAWPVAVFMKLGLHPADAYSLMVALWLSVAFVSAYGIGRYFSVCPILSILGAVSWMTMPVIWVHAGYSMLSTGIGLLPFYFLAALQLFMPKSRACVPGKLEAVKWISFYLAACLISIFMDGYSFMMFAVGASLLGAWLFVSDAESRRRLIWFSFPVHFFGLGIAYLLYTLYIGKTHFEPASIAFFRGWGVDVVFLLVPTRGVHWLPDLLGWSVKRSGDVFFGDSSVWITSFSIPVIVGSIWAALYVLPRKNIAFGLILVSVFGFYMALGPSLKVNSVKPAGEKVDRSMAAKYAIAPTGSALLSQHLPGFKNMRASYRWLALGDFGAWALLVLAMSSGNRRAIVSVAVVIVGVVTLLNLPNLPRKLKADIKNREMFFRLDSELVNEMKAVVSPHEKVAFLPWRNDFLVNYVASRLSIVTFNIGGDKNLAGARLHWPETMRQFPEAAVDDNFANRTLLLLAKNEVDVVILPYIDMRMEKQGGWPQTVQFRETLGPSVAQLNSSGFIDLEDRHFYAVVRLKPEFSRLAKQGALETVIKKKLCMTCDCLKHIDFDPSTAYPISVADRSVSLRHALGTGWHDLEVDGVWSGSEAGLMLPVPSECQSGRCRVKIHFSAFGASTNRPVDVFIRGNKENAESVHPIRIMTSLPQEVVVPLDSGESTQCITIQVPSATSPNELQGSDDTRVLGIALHSIELIETRSQ